MSKSIRVCALQIAICAIAACLLGGWSYFRYGQHKLAEQAKTLLDDVKSVQTGVTTESQLQPMLQRWRSLDADLGPDCDEGGCVYKVWDVSALPSMLSGLSYDADEGAHSWARLAGHLGLRSVGVNAGIVVRNGVVVEKWFSELTAVPVRDWYLRGGAYVPDLSVSAGEFLSSSSRYRCEQGQTHCARNLKGPYAITVSYTTAETDAHKRDYMKFNLGCLTQFRPCRSESEILAVSEHLLEESKRE